MKVKAISVSGEDSEQVVHLDCSSSKGYEFETSCIPARVSGFLAVDTELFCYECRGFLGFYSAEEQTLRRAVFEALDACVGNGYEIADATFCALELIELDSTVEELVGLKDTLPGQLATPLQIRRIVAFVEEWKKQH